MLALARMCGAVVLLTACELPCVLSFAQAQSRQDVFRNQTITLYVGLEVGGSYDLYGRLLARYLGQHIPGRPTIIVKNKTGAGGMVLANSLYNVEKNDGTVLAILNQTAALAQRLSYQGVAYDVANLSWIGRMATGDEVVAVAAASGIRSIEDAKKKEVVMGATGLSGTSALYPLLLNNSVGTKFKVVIGFSGMSSTWLAMERGEIDGGSYGFAALKSTKADWLREKRLNILVQVATKRQPDFPDVPLLYEVATNDVDREALRLYAMPAGIGRALVAPPGLPDDRREMLRNAFDATMSDPQFLADAKKIKADIEPLTGKELTATVAASAQIPDAVAQRAKQLVAR